MKLKPHKRWNASRKAEVAMVLLKGESLEEVSRLTGQSNMNHEAEAALDF